VTQDEIFLTKLNDKIASLTQQFAVLSKKKIHEPCFDAQLFNYQGVLLNGYTPYLSELESNYQKLANLINKENQNHYLEQIVYLSDLIVKQLSALQRELSTLSLRKTKNSLRTEPTLHEQHAKNLGYLNELQSMKYQLQQDLKFQPDEQTKQLAVIEKRIANCRHALLLIEQQIEKN